ncbi:MAG: hypothetical protein K2X27_07525 [Candidatus Obscuribacterales bacterium]|nr:hypothetical protein [Candidatus Obscuribacterales bacterium]
MNLQKLSNPYKLFFALLLNCLIPGLGNFIFVTRTLGTAIIFALSLWAWTMNNPRIILAWMLVMGIKAVIDIYVLPPLISKRQKEQLAKLNFAREQHEAISQKDEHHHLHPGESHSFGMPEDSDHIKAHQKSGELHVHSSDTNSHDYHPAYTKKPEQELLKLEIPGLESEAPEHMKRPSWHQHDEEKHSHGEAIPLTMLHSNESHPHSTEKADERKLLNQHEPENPLTSQHHEHKIIHPDSPLQNPHELREAFIHENAGVTENEDSGFDGVYDIYDEPDRENSIAADPQLFHKLGQSPEVSKNKEKPGTELELKIEHKAAEKSEHKLIQQNALAASEEREIHAPGQRKQELCSNCGRPREQRRPSCPACGTKFETEEI